MLHRLLCQKTKIFYIFDYGASPTMSENEDFLQRIRGLETAILYYYYGNIKTWTIYFRLVVCIHIRSYLIWISHQSKYLKNSAS